ncbi:MAG: hypothetical protein JAZ03_08210 [Candidatus Thiodiazotropha taylori]|nr:hypothetical protein [Candidatus Thiodiazotropha taylori]MCW4333908.1 C2H2-type zinc finger protein [Candidatus Thiodiazotropha endolucinida]
MTEVDDEEMYHAQSLVDEDETESKDEEFSDTDDEILFHAQSQSTPEETPKEPPQEEDDVQEAPPNPASLPGSLDTIILGDDQPIMTDSEIERLIFNSFNTFETDTPKQPSFSCQVSPNIDIVQAAAAAAGVSCPTPAANWDDAIADNELAQVLIHSPPSFQLSRLDSINSQSQTQTYLEGNIDSALRHLHTATELRQWAEEYNRIDCPRVLRALVSLGDSDALLRLQLRDLNDFKSISLWASGNDITDHALVREKLLKISKDYDISSLEPNASLDELISHVQCGLLPKLKFHPHEACATVVPSPTSQGSPAAEGSVEGNTRAGRGSSESKVDERSVGESLFRGVDKNDSESKVGDMGSTGVKTGIEHDSTTTGATEGFILESSVTIEPFRPLNGVQEPCDRPDMVGRGDDSERFKCELCGKSFAFKQDLARHKKHKHENVSYECPQCLKAFSTKSNLSRHKLGCKATTTAKGYECLQCKKVFCSTSGLKKHCTTRHNVDEKGVTCRTCKTEFSNRRELCQHKRNDCKPL